MSLKNLISPIFGFMMILSSCFLLTACKANDTLLPINDDEKVLIDKALDAYVGSNKDAREQVLSMFTPVLIYLPDMVCVGFKAKSHVIGGEFAACFAKSDNSLILTHNEGM